MKTVSAFFRNQAAATSIEYAIIAAGIALAIVVTVNELGTTVSSQYTAIKAAFN